MRNIYLITGMSASGKTSIANELEDTYGLKQIQSYTTRPKRYENETGHIFVSNEEFDKLTDFVGYTEYHGHRYAATAQQVEENDLYVINPDGIEYFKKNYKGSKGYKVIFIKASAYTCMNRMQSRGGMVFSQILDRIKDDLVALKAVKSDIFIENEVENEQNLAIKSVFDYIRRCESADGSD